MKSRKNDASDNELGKLFIGGLSWETTQETLQSYFMRYGEVIDCVVMKNENGRSRGFGFITFAEPDNVDIVLKNGPHNIDGRTVDPKACNPRTMQKRRDTLEGNNYTKVFLGGLPGNVTETDIRTFFERFGRVIHVAIMYDQEKKKTRGFGFLWYESAASAIYCCKERFFNLCGKQVEVKEASLQHNKNGDSNGWFQSFNRPDLDGGHSWANPGFPEYVNGHHNGGGGSGSGMNANNYQQQPPPVWCGGNSNMGNGYAGSNYPNNWTPNQWSQPTYESQGNTMNSMMKAFNAWNLNGGASSSTQMSDAINYHHGANLYLGAPLENGAVKQQETDSVFGNYKYSVFPQGTNSFLSHDDENGFTGGLVGAPWPTSATNAKPWPPA